jgi:hypoxanthine phosphoribosyltransferase
LPCRVSSDLPALLCLREKDSRLPMSVGFDKNASVVMLQTENTCTLPAFAHESEEEFANFLDFYNIEWSYEPICFPIDWDEEGRVKECFTPDFYLPKFDLYVELTTMKQSLVTKKNRKIRLMREYYPDIRVKILYNRDYRKLLFKFGILE